MNMRITDLMDYYRGEPVKALLESGGFEKLVSAAKPENISRGRKPMMIAAALLLLVTAGIGLTFFVSRTPGGAALEQGTKQPESVSETVSPEVPAVVPESSAEESGVTVEQDYIEPYVIAGSPYASLRDLGCYGNLLRIDGVYYTVTDNGPEIVELQNHTDTVELLGSTWNVDIDYAVLDGELVLHNNLTTEPYAQIDGETVYQAEYYAATNDRPEERETIDWIKPEGVTYAFPLEGSTDTVRLEMDTETFGRYICRYNILTGEVADLLSDVSGLWDGKPIYDMIVNSTFTYALAWRQEDSLVPYLCDLATGEMKSVLEIVHGYTPGAEEGEVSLPGNGMIYWTDEDTLLIRILEDIGLMVNEGIDESHESWLYYYNVKTGEMELEYTIARENYINIAWADGYIVGGTVRDREGNESYEIIDTASGTVYTIPIAAKQVIMYSPSERYDLITHMDDSFARMDICLVDKEHMTWVDIDPDQGEQLTPDRIQGDWLVFTKGLEETRFYRIPDNLPMIPLEAK